MTTWLAGFTLFLIYMILPGGIAGFLLVAFFRKKLASSATFSMLFPACSSLLLLMVLSFFRDNEFLFLWTVFALSAGIGGWLAHLVLRDKI